MAEQTGLRNNALPYPLYAVPFGIVFPLLDADGDPISPSSPDSEVSKNGDTFADCTNEAVEIATSTGICYLLLTAAEMTADVVAVRIQSTGAKTTVMTLYPRKLVAMRTGTCAGGAAGSMTLDASASAVDDFYNGMVVVGVLDGATEARVITDYTGSTQVAAVTPNWNTTPDSDDTFTIYLPEGVQINQANATHIAGAAVSTSTAQLGVNVVNAAGTAWGSGAITAASIATDAITAAKIAADAIGASELAADAVTEINAPLLAVLGALNDAAADGAVTSTDTVVAYLKQLINTLEGAPGIPTWPAAAAPGNAVSIAEALRWLADQVGTAGAGLTAADDAVITAIAGVQSDTDNIQTRLPAALTSDGNIKADTLRVGGTLQTAGDLSAQIDAVDNFVDTEVSAIKTVTDAIGATGAGLSAIPWNAAWDAEVQSEAADALNAYDPPTHAELTSELATADDAVLAAIAALNNLSSANIRTAVGLASANLDTQLDALPTNAELATALAAADDAVLAAIAALNNLSQANIRTALGLGSANLDTQLDALPTNTELATALGTADDAVLAAIAALNNLSSAQATTATLSALGTVLADSVPADGSLPTALQALYEVRQFLFERSVSGTTLTTKKVNGSTPLETFTLDSPTAPTSITRAT